MSNKPDNSSVFRKKVVPILTAAAVAAIKKTIDMLAYRSTNQK